MIQFFQEVQSLDNRACAEFQLSHELLMENAANNLANFIRHIVSTKQIKPRKKDEKIKILIAAGPGNNGADSIALARILQDEFNIIVYLPFGTKSKLCMKQLERANALEIDFCTNRTSKTISVQYFLDTIENISLREWAKDADIIIDGLFGSGLNRPLDDKACEVIDWLNSLQGIKISCDIPSGISHEGDVMWTAFRADYSCIMGACTEAILADRVKDFIGEIHICSLGLSRKMYESMGKPSGFLLEKTDLKLPTRSQSHTHKGTFGHLVILMGEKEGAAILSALSAFQFGTGVVTIIGDSTTHIPSEIIHSFTLPTNPAAIAAGMGLGDFAFQDRRGVRDTLLNRPCLLDADILYQDITKEILEQNPRVVLTPHPKEFVALMRLLGIADCEVLDLQRDRFRFVRLFSHSYPNATLLLKGANHIIAQNDRLAVNYLGIPSLAKGGSGDVLSGLIAALLAQGIAPFEAACNASLAHTLAARSLECASYALTPQRLIEAVSRLEQRETK
ncbi:hypothetical protein CCZ01_00735 [Helicobacter monodelphidis]|uniref:NAD(P)H-hydrate dehydratase n=1 Tax=Helicobacter sp. 15-1451 TaxID=2004995 RepID=UPI000DCE972A|nr:NAD(P)H-hydrate dehydratase [Helicobacter sp. 15-1451]RAX59297.1 hypothetical protein CCZ01_00735 [Helicobacter sp. 15-1451]